MHKLSRTAAAIGLLCLTLGVAGGWILVTSRPMTSASMFETSARLGFGSEKPEGAVPYDAQANGARPGNAACVEYDPANHTEQQQQQSPDPAPLPICPPAGGRQWKQIQQQQEKQTQNYGLTEARLGF